MLDRGCHVGLALGNYADFYYLISLATTMGKNIERHLCKG